MSYHYSTDRSQNEIVRHLERIGVWVYDAAKIGNGFPDLIVFKTEMCLMELKEADRFEFKRLQLVFMSRCRPPILYVKTAEAAARYAREPRRYGLKQSQKDKLAAMLIFDKRKVFPGKEIDKLLFPNET